jgi:hypothetical protein
MFMYKGIYIKYMYYSIAVIYEKRENSGSWGKNSTRNAGPLPQSANLDRLWATVEEVKAACNKGEVRTTVGSILW